MHRRDIAQFLGESSQNSKLETSRLTSAMPPNKRFSLSNVTRMNKGASQEATQQSGDDKKKTDGSSRPLLGGVRRDIGHYQGVRGDFLSERRNRERERERERGRMEQRLRSFGHIFVRIVASSPGITRKIDRTYLPEPNYTSVHPPSLSCEPFRFRRLVSLNLFTEPFP